ncbi:MAG: hypothetical protein OXI95_01770 [bacterium]|nr:hypothetical protein [bacterium]
MTIPSLEISAVGSPITRLGVSFFPVYLTHNPLPAIDTGESSGLIVSEFDVATVRALKVTNPTDKPILIVEGEHFTGGNQNRTINATVLVPAGSKLDIPVSCLEQGRWGRHRAWRRAQAFAPESIRKRKRASVNRSFSVDRNRMSDQHAIWEDISAMMLREGVASPTGAAADLEESYRRHHSRWKTVEALVERGPLPGQCGVVVAHGRDVTAMDLFGAPHLLRKHWGALVRSHFIENRPSQGRPSATLALRNIRRLSTSPARTAPGVGLGCEHRVTDRRLTGQALVLDDALIHASFSYDTTGSAHHG